MTETPHTHEHLTTEECLELLGTVTVGRIAVAVPGEAPVVVPVNFAMEEDVIVFRSDEGSKLDALRLHPASFQVDWVDPLHRTGWSVLVKGFAYETSPASVEVETWDEGSKAHWVRLYPGEITGRRIVLALGELDERGYR
jgi:nitroimidazol reductase NimA-like FMN-containing flavoprotein (pyridoxamine 5'-phosphate oxidase superfamily)